MHRGQRRHVGGYSRVGMRLAMMTTTVVGANEPISMEVSPAMSSARANLVIRTRLEPDVNNRAMEVIAESGGPDCPWAGCGPERAASGRRWFKIRIARQCEAGAAPGTAGRPRRPRPR